METLRPLVFANGPMRRAVTRPIRCQYQRFLQTSAPKPATPIPHPTAPGPPPPPPRPAVTQPDDRVLRKRKQAELLQRGKELKANSARPITALRKRFWKHATVKDAPEGLQIYLDTRPVRTASKEILTIPHSKHQLATAIALEWDLLVSSQQAFKHHYIPLTSLTSRAVDIQNADSQGDSKVREDVVALVMKYLHTDTLLCWAPKKNLHDPGEENRESLRDMQMRIAKPIIGFLTTKVWPGVEIKPILEADSILPAPQPEMTQEVIRGWLSGLPAFELAGLERSVLASKSLLVAVRLLVEWSQEFTTLRKEYSQEGRFGIEEASQACSLEVNWQTGMWGEVEDTHDVEKEDLRRQLGGVVLLVNGETS